VKRLWVKAGKRLSYQLHEHRSEHWVVVTGVVTVTVNDRERTMRPGEFAFIPRGCKHRIANNSGVGAEIIETQLGERCEEDDIIRFADDHGRV
jgi:mannose-1-phosphate guanylyltransferase / mannose-6-phosphate isomerase